MRAPPNRAGAVAEPLGLVFQPARRLDRFIGGGVPMMNVAVLPGEDLPVAVFRESPKPPFAIFGRREVEGDERIVGGDPAGLAGKEGEEGVKIAPIRVRRSARGEVYFRLDEGGQDA
jgi:hypothetical protein